MTVKVFTLCDIQKFIDNSTENIPYFSYINDDVKIIVNDLDKIIVDLNPVVQHSINYEQKSFHRTYDESTKKNYNHNSYRHKQPHTSIESWIAVRNFKPTKMEVKEGIEKNINEIRSVLNKITNKNYDTQKDLIFTLIEKNIASIEEDETLDKTDMMQKIGEFIFDISSTNKFYSELYADLYKEFVEKYDVFLDILYKYCNSFKELKLLPFVDSSVNYDKYCEYTKTNEKHRSMIHFFILLMKRNLLDIKYIIDFANLYSNIITDYINQDNYTNEVDEYTELLFIIMTNGKDNLINNTEYTKIYEKIQILSSYKIRECNSLSSRSIFKYKDLIKFLNN